VRLLFDRMGLLEKHITIAVIGAQGAETSQLPVGIKGYDEEALQGSSLWNERAQQGWPCNLGTYLDEDSGTWNWFAEAYISKSLFEKLTELHRLKLIKTLRIALRLNIFVPSYEKYAPGPVTEFFLIPKDGKVNFPSSAMGFVEDIFIKEVSIPLHSHEIDKQSNLSSASANPSSSPNADRLSILEHDVAQLRKTVDRLERRSWWRRLISN
jgi:hypothetical protein